MDIARKLELLADAAKYDVACTSSGVDRSGKKGQLGAATQAGCCHSFTPDGRCVTLLKVLMTNVCTCDCAYCVNRVSNLEIERTAFTPRELADLTIGFYRRNFIEGLFLSSGVAGSPDNTTERMISALEILRHEYGFRGYIHAKAIPGTSPELLHHLGLLCRSPQREHGAAQRREPGAAGPRQDQAQHPGPHAPDMRQLRRGRRVPLPRPTHHRSPGPAQAESRLSRLRPRRPVHPDDHRRHAGIRPPHPQPVRRAVPHPIDEASVLQRLCARDGRPAPAPNRTQVQLNREHRLYQADWLMRFYQFDVDEIIDEKDPFLDLEVDPKAAWALRHLDLFPVEVNTASYEVLLRVPGIGVRGAKLDPAGTPPFHLGRRAAAQAGYRLEASPLLRHLQRGLCGAGRGLLRRLAAGTTGLPHQRRPPRAPQREGGTGADEPLRRAGCPAGPCATGRPRFWSESHGGTQKRLFPFRPASDKRCGGAIGDGICGRPFRCCTFHSPRQGHHDTSYCKANPAGAPKRPLRRSEASGGGAVLTWASCTTP